jgi:Ca2+-binding EF-hand superfamily protein
MVENVVSQFDRDGDGYLDRWELMVCARALALDETQESMFELFSEIQQEVVITKSMPDGGHGGGNSVQFNAFRVPNDVAIETVSLVSSIRTCN